MKSIIRTAAFAITIAALAALSSFTIPVQAATVTPQPKPATTTAEPDSHPVPTCPPGDPNGCGIYS